MIRLPGGNGKARDALVVQRSEETISPGEAARLLGVSPRTLRDWSKKGKITCTHTLGGHRRYRRADVLLLRSMLGTGPSADLPHGTAWELEDLLRSLEGHVQQVKRLTPVGATLRETAIMEEELNRARALIRALIAPGRRRSVG